MKKKIWLLMIAFATVAFVAVSCSQSSSCPTFDGVKQPVNKKYSR